MKFFYKVMCIVGTPGFYGETMVAEYTGTIFENLESAKRELIEAKKACLDAWLHVYDSEDYVKEVRL